jgi:hypothetical protein
MHAGRLINSGELFRHRTLFALPITIHRVGDYSAEILLLRWRERDVICGTCVEILGKAQSQN